MKIFLLMARKPFKIPPFPESEGSAMKFKSTLRAIAIAMGIINAAGMAVVARYAAEWAYYEFDMNVK